MLHLCELFFLQQSSIWYDISQLAIPIIILLIEGWCLQRSYWTTRGHQFVNYELVKNSRISVPQTTIGMFLLSKRQSCLFSVNVNYRICIITKNVLTWERRWVPHMEQNWNTLSEHRQSAHFLFGIVHLL